MHRHCTRMGVRDSQSPKDLLWSMPRFSQLLYLSQLSIILDPIVWPETTDELTYLSRYLPSVHTEGEWG